MRWGFRGEPGVNTSVSGRAGTLDRTRPPPYLAGSGPETPGVGMSAVLTCGWVRLTRHWRAWLSSLPLLDEQSFAPLLDADQRTPPIGASPLPPQRPVWPSS